MEWNRKDAFLLGKNKIEAELDVVDILKSIRDIKLMTKVIFETHQAELLKFNREALLAPSTLMIQTDSEKSSIIPASKNKI